MNDEFLTPQEAADYLRRKKQTLANWRSAGKGPDYYKVGEGVLYRLSDLDAFADKKQAQRRRATHWMPLPPPQKG